MKGKYIIIFNCNYIYLSPPRLLPPPECHHINSHAFIACNNAIANLEIASSGVFFRAAKECQCSECCLEESATQEWAVAPGVESSSSLCYSPSNSCSSSSSSTRPPSSSFFPPTPQNWPQPTTNVEQQQPHPNYFNTSSSSQSVKWQKWINELICEVQAEIKAEQQVNQNLKQTNIFYLKLCQSRKRKADVMESYCSSSPGINFRIGVCIKNKFFLHISTF